MKKGTAFINYMLSQVGTPYLLGASGKDGKWDCSGLTSKAAAHIGLYLYHGATTSWRQGVESHDFIQYGDVKDMPLDRECLLFHADTTKPGTMAHIGAYSPEIGVVQSGGRRGKGTHTNKLIYGDWTKYAIMDHWDAEVDENALPFPVLWGCGQGYWVERLQTQLQLLGYDIGRTGVDGSFGPKTLQAVKQLQIDAGLKADGIVGASTWKALYAAETDSMIIEVHNGTPELVEAIKKLLEGYQYVVR